jgi:hypothetical protein
MTKLVEIISIYNKNLNLVLSWSADGDAEEWAMIQLQKEVNFRVGTKMPGWVAAFVDGEVVKVEIVDVEERKRPVLARPSRRR